MKRLVTFITLIASLILAAKELTPFGHWPINEGAGTVIHNTKGKINGKLFAGAAAEWIAHGESKALLFKNPQKGSNNTRITISAANFDPTQGFSVLVTVKTPESFPVRSRQYEIVNFTHTYSKVQGFRVVMAGDGFWLRIGDGKTLCAIDIPGTRAKLTPDTWYKVAAVFDGEKAAIYLNGVKMAEKGDVVIARPKARQIIVGACSAKTNGFDGAISNLVIYPGAVSEQVIQEYCQEE